MARGRAGEAFVFDDSFEHEVRCPSRSLISPQKRRALCSDRGTSRASPHPCQDFWPNPVVSSVASSFVVGDWGVSCVCEHAPPPDKCKSTA